VATKNKVDVNRMRSYAGNTKVYSHKIYFGTDNATAGDVYQIIPVLKGDVVKAAWAEVVEACTEDATIDLGYGANVNYFGNELLVDTVGQCQTVLKSQKTWDAYLIYDKSEHTVEQEIPGVRYGDHVTVSPYMDCCDMSLTAEVIHPNFVAIHLYNNTGGSLNLAEQTVNISVNKAPQASSPLVFLSGDTIDVVTNEAITTGVLKVSALIFRG